MNKEVKTLKIKSVEDHPIEDVFGLEITAGDRYWVFGTEVVNDLNLERYLMEKQQVNCYLAIPED